MKPISHYINKLIAQGEHQQLDFKFEISDSRKIAKSFVAFANTDGGTLLIGVKDNGRIAGVKTDEEYYMVEAAASMYCKPSVPFEAKRWVVDGKTVLEVVVPKSEQAPHMAEVEPGRSLAYIRVNDENILAHSVHLKVWRTRNSQSGVKFEYSEPGKRILQYLEEHEFLSLSKACKVAMVTRHEAEQILASLIVIEVLEIFYTDGSFMYRRIE